MGLCSLRAAGVRSVLGAQRCAPAACSTAAPSPGVQARAHTRQPWELASTEPALTASPPAAVPAQSERQPLAQVPEFMGLTI